MFNGTLQIGSNIYNLFYKLLTITVISSDLLSADIKLTVR